MVAMAPRRSPATLSPTATITLLTILILSNINQVHGVRCYTCPNAASNDECNKPEHITDCKSISTPATELDTCQTKMSYTEETGIMITKRCVRGPCVLSQGQENALGLDCDRRGSSWSCESCCDNDECNKSGASSLSNGYLVVPLLSLITIMHTYIYL
jgi:hypothetical protein